MRKNIPAVTVWFAHFDTAADSTLLIHAPVVAWAMRDMVHAARHGSLAGIARTFRGTDGARGTTDAASATGATHLPGTWHEQCDQRRTVLNGPLSARRASRRSAPRRLQRSP